MLLANKTTRKTTHGIIFHLLFFWWLLSITEQEVKDYTSIHINLQGRYVSPQAGHLYLVFLYL